VDGERLIAAFLLLGRRLKGAERQQLRLLLNDESPTVRVFAAQTLGAAGDLASLGRMAELLDLMSPRDAFGVAWGIGQLAASATGRARDEAVTALQRYRSRARGHSRQHADLLLARLSNHA